MEFRYRMYDSWKTNQIMFTFALTFLYQLSVTRNNPFVIIWIFHSLLHLHLFSTIFSIIIDIYSSNTIRSTNLLSAIAFQYVLLITMFIPVPKNTN